MSKSVKNHLLKYYAFYGAVIAGNTTAYKTYKFSMSQHSDIKTESVSIAFVNRFFDTMGAVILAFVVGFGTSMMTEYLLNKLRGVPLFSLLPLLFAPGIIAAAIKTKKDQNKNS